MQNNSEATPELASITDAPRWVGISVSTIKRLAASEQTFPPLIRLSPKRVLFDVPATAAWLRGQAEKEPRSIRGGAAAA